ncbi:MAG: hypothetical protein P8L44_06045 [Opitutales bacterium]|nr:hypothetical protein [Opitutales bacterium]
MPSRTKRIESTFKSTVQYLMNKLCVFAGMTIGGYLGWWLGGGLDDLYIAFALSALGNFVGIYFGWRVNRDYLS